VACAAAIAAIDVYVNDKVAENATRVGRHIVDRIEADSCRCPASVPQRTRRDARHGDRRRQADEGDVRPARGAIMPLLDEAREKGLHLRQMGSNRIVIAPPCTTTIEEADRIVDILKPWWRPSRHPTRQRGVTVGPGEGIAPASQSAH